VLQCGAVYPSVKKVAERDRWYVEVGHVMGALRRVAVRCSVLQRVAVCCSMLQCVLRGIIGMSRWGMSWVRCGVLQCVAVCCSVLQCVAVCCSVF